VIAVTAGIAAPLTILAAGIAVVMLGFTVAEFSKVEPSAGSFITYIETSLGARTGVAAAVLVAVGFTVAIAGVFTMAGGMVTLTLAHYTSWHLAWEPLSLVLTVAAIWLTARGVRLSTRTVGLAVVVQVAIMLLVCVVVLIDERSHLSGAPFSWSHLSGGLTGLSAGFPLRFRSCLWLTAISAAWPCWRGLLGSSLCSPRSCRPRTPRHACCSTAGALVSCRHGSLTCAPNTTRR
jgi:amino acid transporter